MTASPSRGGFPQELVEEIAEAVARRLGPRHDHEEDRWMDARGAAQYLGYRSVAPIHKLTAARQIPFSQDSPNGKCWFQRSQLDRWRDANRKGPA